MRSMFSSALRAAALSVAIALPASAQTFGSSTSDNSVLFGRDADFGAVGALAQTFVAPVDAPVLTSFTFSLSDAFFGTDLRFFANVFAFNGDRIVGPALYTSADQVGSGNQGGFDAYLFANVNLSLLSGSTYALVIRPTEASPDLTTNLVATSNQNTFALGSLFLSSAMTEQELGIAGAFTQSTADTFGEDAAVTATFAARAATVPEPSGALLLVTGLGLMAVRVRRRANVRD